MTCAAFIRIIDDSNKQEPIRETPMLYGDRLLSPVEKQRRDNINKEARVRYARSLDPMSLWERLKRWLSR